MTREGAVAIEQLLRFALRHPRSDEQEQAAPTTDRATGLDSKKSAPSRGDVPSARLKLKRALSGAKGVNALEGARVVRALKRSAWKVGGEHMLFQHLKDDTGFVGQTQLEAQLQTADRVNATQALKWMDANGDGKVCESDLNETVIKKLFEEQFVKLTQQCGEEALKTVAGNVFSRKQGKAVVHCLADMSNEDLKQCAGGALEALVASLKEVRDSIRQVNKASKRASAETSKFSFQPADDKALRFLFGNLQMFRAGLDSLIGLPARTVQAAMEREHQSTDRFITGNYGVDTYDLQEYNLVDKQSDVDYEFGTGRVRVDVDRLLRQFMEDDVLKTLTREEVVALVLYTGPMFERYNRVLRTVLFPMAQRMHEGEAVSVDTAQVSYGTTIHMIVSGIIKMSEGTSLHGGRKVYRGLKGRLLPESFTTPDKYGCRGGTELGFMSTTTNIAVAKQYADLDQGVWPTIFEIETGQVDRGASLQRLSQYPGEAEVLLPPLCNLEVTGEPEVHWEGDFGYWLVPMRLNVNLKSRTREQHAERRRREVMGAADSMMLDTKAELHARMRATSKTNPEDGTQLYESLLKEAGGLHQRVLQLDALWFNDDVNFGDALQDLVHARTHSLETMDAFSRDPNKFPASYFTQYSMTMWHRLKCGEAREAWARAAKSGDVSERKAAARRLAEVEGLLAEGAAADSKSGLDGETALMRAAASGNEEMLTVLAHAGCDLDATNDRHYTALLLAVVCGHDGAVAKLVELGADVNKGKEDTLETPLHQAAEHKRVECLKKLIALGADVNRREQSLGRMPLHEAGSLGRLESVQALVQAGSDIHAADSNGAQPIHYAAEYGHVECVRWLKGEGADIHAADNNGYQPIHRAAMNGHVECVRWLKGEGADIHAANNYGYQPIHLAAMNGHVECVRWLKGEGADIHAADNYGNQPIHLAAMNGHVECVRWLKGEGADIHAANNDGSQPIHLAAMDGHVECARWLKGEGADIHAASNDGYQPIHEAAANGHVECVRWLKGEGADIHAASNDGSQPILLAAMNGHVECARWLKGEGADIHAADNAGDQPIHLAAVSGSVECVAYLVGEGADIHAINHLGNHPIHSAAKNGKAECVRWLAGAGAAVGAANKDGWEPMHWAAKCGSVECGEALRGAGAGLEGADGKGDRPVHVAAREGEGGFVEWLLEAGAEGGAVNGEGRRAEEEAAAHGKEECVQLLRGERGGAGGGGE